MMREISLSSSFDLGAAVLSDGRTHFRVWAPRRRHVDLHLHSPGQQTLPMSPANDGYFELTLNRDATGARYTYRLDDAVERPDPASRLQESGVHGPSTVVAENFEWKASAWCGIPLSSYVIYELHIGAFTAEGTLDAAIGRIPYLLELGVTAVELMPVAQFPGDRNWGYDGVYPFAVQTSYGGPEALKRFVDACHLAGLAVVLDVVYNHLGPEGNYLRDFGPYFTNRHHTPWGDGINFDGADSGPVRHFFLQNALNWVTEFRIDALRLDATDTIYDFSPKHFLAELAEKLHLRGEALNRRIYALAESAANDVRWVRSAGLGGFGLDAQWNDDFHHALRQTLTGERRGYFADYPDFQHLVRSLEEGFVYQGEYSAYRRRAHGSPSREIPPERFIVCCQNHDQVGNRLKGDRLGHAVDLSRLKLAAAWVLLSPYVPLLFMGEDYNEPAPFPYFVSHGDPDLVAAVREGRKKEFAAFAWEGEPPDPQSEGTYLSAKIQPDLRHSGPPAELFRFYRELIRLRKHLPPLTSLSRREIHLEADEAGRVVWASRRFQNQECVLAFAFGENEARMPYPFASGRFRKHIDTSKPGTPSEAPEIQLLRNEIVTVAPHSVLLLERCFE
ncbi:MAG: malto-oligosyltrehalose trehalohydrolase [Bryobacterales bacterium]|nr:malto-oligosyltrehalose trehalohydrolase [Bryobacterales bacterium]